MATQKTKEVNLKSSSKKEFLLFHGYTGSPTDFNKLGVYLHKKFNANVRIINFKGHGTKIEDLDSLEYKDFIKQAESEIEKDLKKGMEIIVGGYSFGGLIALYLASKYPVKSVFNIVTPYKLKWYFNLPLIFILARMKKYWKKQIPEEERMLREGSFRYDKMHSNGIIVVHDMIPLVKKSLHKITAPCLTIHSEEDTFSAPKTGQKINSDIKSKIKKLVLFKAHGHSLFYSRITERVYHEISSFFIKNHIFVNKELKKEKIAAIIPCYNEAERIGDVLKALKDTKQINEIIVVDDGSTDDTSEVVKKFKSVKYIKNTKNLGKGKSMDIGVKHTDAEIILFCDGDVRGLNPYIIENTLNPVIKEEFDMFVAGRGNAMQKTVKAFAINSGERALRREIWEELPEFYKKGFRIEAGLNYYAKNYGKGFGYRMFSHSQPLKEKKYGFVEGTWLRWRMNFDVVTAWVSCLFMNLLLERVKH